jgi:hypothetical protein
LVALTEGQPLLFAVKGFCPFGRECYHRPYLAFKMNNRAENNDPNQDGETSPAMPGNRQKGAAGAWGINSVYT